ncbi:MAG: glycerol-3-phosphate dehydrogenase/oxidase [Prevotellaceae bacterium]|jgi:glycerol-3-phosphate dehydrogenase|nr:glycerol-3-phosphate dehydrogenase/oxidase [Prevotellaceae bacterium]
MDRDKMMDALKENQQWDVVVIGGGATGLGVAVDAAARGYKVALLEMIDFAKGTSCKSTKLVHGGVRYLQHGDVMLVWEALRERGRMKQNAPHLVKDQSFVISNYTYWNNFLYFCGLTFYDMLSFGFGYGRSRFISAGKVIKCLPTTVKRGLKGGIVYHDGQFDDSRMAVNLAQTCTELGGVVVNKAKVTAMLHDEVGKVAGVKFTDAELGEEITLKARCVVNACGVFVDNVMSMDAPEHKKMVTPSQGVHLVFDKKFLPGDYAVMIPKTSDGRVLFAVPWHDKVVVGTTDIMRPEAELEPLPLKEEIDFILNTAALYFETPPQYADILSVFAGQRPLAAPKNEGKSTKELSRGHKIIVSPHKLITITGGKWTSYRRMAEDTLDKAIKLGLLEAKKCRTKNLRIHGYRPHPDLNNHLYVYGSDEAAIRDLAGSTPAYAEKLHNDYPYTVAEVIWAVRHEMARDVEDVLARRVRLLYIDARAAIAAAPAVAQVIAKELNKGQDWIDRQIETFTALSQKYLITN